MKSLGASLALVLAIGLLAAGGVWALNLERTSEIPALIGCLMGTLFGLSALTVKARAHVPVGGAGVKNLLAQQGLTFGFRLAALLVGALAMSRRGFEPSAYLVAFMVCYLLQLGVETRMVLARNMEK
jgi:hypothetical protein